MRSMQKITPHIWFEDQAMQAARWYCDIFADAEILSDVTLSGTPSGEVQIVTLRLQDLQLQFLNAGNLLERNPSFSYLISCSNNEQIDTLWQQLSEDATVLMPLQQYPFSQRYGWLQDKYGVSWQLMHDGGQPVQRITPALLFTNERSGQAEIALNTLVDLFEGKVMDGHLARRTAELDDREISILDYARCQLPGTELVMMDSDIPHDFGFNEMQSLMLYCEDQAELDFYWQKLSSLPDSEQCGWLTDQFGISWQVIPRALEQMMIKGNVQQRAAITQAFLSMKKMDIAKLELAYQQAES